MYEFKTLSNGIRVIGEKIPHLKSVTIGVWVGNGSRHEEKEVNGISHFIEHMVFKGTQKRSARDIASQIDCVGGMLNAFTAREYTCFYTKTLDSHARLALDILSDMIFSPLLLEEDLKLERNVIYEEIGMYEDSPEDLVFDLASEAVWGDTPLGRTVLGTKESLANINSDVMRTYMKSHYTSKNIIVSVAGNYDSSLFELLEMYLGTQKLLNTMPNMDKGLYVPKNIVKEKDIEQVQIVASFKGIDVYDEATVPLLVFNNVFGSGMSSRLFQNIREKYGLVYSIGAGHCAYIDCGTFDVSAGMNGDNLEMVCSLVCDVINRVKREKLTKEEVSVSKEQLKGSYILSAESTNARMQGAGRSLLLNKKIYTQEEMLSKIDAVTPEDVADVIDTIFDKNTLAITALGPVKTVDGLFDGLI